MGNPGNSSDPTKLWAEVGSRRNFGRWLAAGWLQSYLIFLLRTHGKFMAHRPTHLAWYFLSETACKLGNLHRVHGSRKLFTRSRVHVCSMFRRKERRKRGSKAREFNFFGILDFFGLVLSLARWMERKVSFRQFWVTGIFINFILLASFKFSENF